MKDRVGFIPIYKSRVLYKIFKVKTIYARIGDLKADGTDEFGVSLGEVSSQLASMGIQILDQQGNIRDMGTIIEEVAQKWNIWTEAQRQAAAIAMAGKR